MHSGDPTIESSVEADPQEIGEEQQHEEESERDETSPTAAEEKPFACDKCSKGYTTSRGLKYHNDRHPDCDTEPPAKRSKRSAVYADQPKNSSGDRKAAHFFTPEVLQFLNTMKSMRDHDELTSVVKYASGVLEKQDDLEAREGIKQLADIDGKYREATREVFGELLELLDRFGAMPVGGLESLDDARGS